MIKTILYRLYSVDIVLTSEAEFSRSSMATHWRAGYRDTVRRRRGFRLGAGRSRLQRAGPLQPGPASSHNAAAYGLAASGGELFICDSQRRLSKKSASRLA